MVQVKFKKFGSNSAFGGFAPGDMLRVSDEMAAHLVEQDVAVYADTPTPAAARPAPEDTKPVVNKRKAKQ